MGGPGISPHVPKAKWTTSPLGGCRQDGTTKQLCNILMPNRPVKGNMPKETIICCSELFSDQTAHQWEAVWWLWYVYIYNYIYYVLLIIVIEM